MLQGVAGFVDQKSRKPKTARQRYSDLGAEIVAFKDSIPHTCKTQRYSPCLKCDVNMRLLGAFEHVKRDNFPKDRD